MITRARRGAAYGSRVLATLALVVAALAPAPATATAVTAARPAAVLEGWRPRVAAARAYARTRPGTVSFAVRTGSLLAGHRVEREVRSASVVKAMLLVAYLREPGVRDRPLRAADRAVLDPMVRRSDNATASRVLDRVGDDALLRLARAAGMPRFTPRPAWGASLVSATEQTRLFLRIDRFVPRRHRRYAMGLLARIVPEQRWGVPRAAPRGWRLAFKGGWGAGTGAVTHQVALLRCRGERLAVAVLTTDNVSHPEGVRTLEGVMRRLLRGLPACRAG
jgi:hypothetical protein